MTLLNEFAVPARDHIGSGTTNFLRWTPPNPNQYTFVRRAICQLTTNAPVAGIQTMLEARALTTPGNVIQEILDAQENPGNGALALAFEPRRPYCLHPGEILTLIVVGDPTNTVMQDLWVEFYQQVSGGNDA